MSANNSFKPKVSIIIPVYNGANFLTQAIDSALAQTYNNFEVLVINDGSSDAGETEKIATSYGDQVHYYKKSNGGVASALNLAIDKMSGEFFSWLSHDDLYENEKIMRQIEALSCMPNTERGKAVFYSDYYVFSNDKEKTIPKLMRGVPHEEFRYWLTIENALHGCTILVPKAALIEYGGFNERLETTQDYDLWFRMAEKYNFIHLPECLIKARCHSEQGSRKLSELAHVECDTLFLGFVEKLTSDELLRSSHQVLEVAYARIGASMQYRGYFNAGRLAIHLSIKNFRHSTLRTIVLVGSIISKSIIKRYIVKSIWRLLSPNGRLTIRSWIVQRKVPVAPYPSASRNKTIK